jgi:HK97 family phage portal protein
MILKLGAWQMRTGPDAGEIPAPIISVDGTRAKAIRDGDVVFDDQLAQGAFYGMARGGQIDKTQLLRGWVFNCAHHIATRAASLPLQLYKRTSPQRDKWSQVEQHPFLDLWNRPNPILYGYPLRYVIFMQLDTIGRAVLYMPKNKLGRPESIWPLIPSRVKVEQQEDGTLGYRYTLKSGRVEVLDPAEVVDIRWPHPFALVSGMSAMDAHAIAMDVSRMLEQYEHVMLKSGARPDYIISPKDGEWGSEADARKFKRDWEAQHSGLQGRATVAVPMTSVTVDKLNWSNDDLQFEVLTTYFKDTIQGAYGTPDTKFGKGTSMNRATAWAIDMQFNRDVISPRLTLLLEPFNAEVLPVYDSRLVGEFDNPVPQDEEFDRETARIELTNAVISINEYRERRGMPRVPWGDRPLVAISTVPLDPAGGLGRVPAAPPPAKAEKTLAREPAEVVWKTFLSRQEPWERLMQGVVAKQFDRQAAAVSARVKANMPKALGVVAGMSRRKVDGALKHELKDLVTDTIDLSEFDDDLADALKEVIREQLRSEGQAVIDETGVSITYDFDSPRARQTIGRLMDRIRDINRTTEDLLADALKEAIRNGESVYEMSTRIMGIFDAASRSRALTIARTETTSAQNLATVDGWDQSGVVKGKQWLTAMDEKVRPEHMVANGAMADLDGDFIVGGERLSYPGDPRGSASNNCNCRCTVVAVLDEEA